MTQGPIEIIPGNTYKVRGTFEANVEFVGDEPEPPEEGFVLGRTEPTKEGQYTPSAVTGPRVPETSLVNYAGSFDNLSDGDVVDRLIITGQFNPDATDWILRDSIVEGGVPPGGETDPMVRNAIWPLFDIRDSAVQSGRIEHCEARPTYQSHEIYGFKGGNCTLYRCLIRGVVDGAQPHGSGSNPAKKVAILGTLIEDLATFDDPNQSDGITHNDGSQASGALDSYVLFGSSLKGGRTSAQLIQQQSGTYGDILIGFNWLYGNPDTGSTLNTSQNGKGVIAASGLFLVVGNRISKAGNTPHVLISESTLESPTFFWRNNTYIEDGSEVVPTKGSD